MTKITNEFIKDGITKYINMHGDDFLYDLDFYSYLGKFKSMGKTN